MDINTKTSIWSERYKPQHVSDVILPVEISNQIQEFIKSGNMPNLGFWSPEPGLGKSSTANAIIHDLGCEALWINASLENGIDLLRSKIATFASQQTFSDSCNFKVVVMDECLDENEKIQLSDGVIALKDMQKGKIYNCKSLNLDTGEVEDDTCEIVSEKEADIYEVTFENGRTIRVTSNHPFILHNRKNYETKSIDKGLSEGDEVVVIPNTKISTMNETEVYDLVTHSLSELSNIVENKQDELFKGKYKVYNKYPIKIIFNDLYTDDIDRYRANLIKLLELIQKYDSNFTDDRLNEIIDLFNTFDDYNWLDDLEICSRKLRCEYEKRHSEELPMMYYGFCDLANFED